MSRSAIRLSLWERAGFGIYRMLVKWQKHFELIERSFENAALLRSLGSCGSDVHIYAPIHITFPQNMRVGSNVHIAQNAFIRAEGGLTIGDNSHVSRNLVLYTVNHRYKDALRIPYDDHLELKPVTIGRNVWIGMNVCITPGSTIGDGAIVGMGTVVSGDVPPLTIIGSQKWRTLHQRNTEHYQLLDQQNDYGGVSGKALAKQYPSSSVTLK